MYSTIKSDSIFKATIEIQHQLQMQYANLKFKPKGFTFPSQGTWQLLVSNNTRPTHLKGENEN
jgi:hypothetical protein